jgi:3-hydroxyacyl-CoA dehydrogenase
MRIGKIGVIGAGAMGSGIAALAASAGFPVVLLDVPGDTDKNAPARNGVQRALKGKPPQFMAPDRAALITIGNTADDLMSLADCDWIIEAIIEQPVPKRQLFEQLERVINATAIVSTNTSAIPIRHWSSREPSRFVAAFRHLFQPAALFHPLEVIPTGADGARSRRRHPASRAAAGKGSSSATSRFQPRNRLGIHGFPARDTVHVSRPDDRRSTCSLAR